MDRRDYHNLGPRLDLGLKANRPANTFENEPAPYRRQPPYQQENQDFPPPPEDYYDPHRPPVNYADQEPYSYDHEPDSEKVTRAKTAPGKKTGFSRWLVWLALLLSVAALLASLIMGRLQSADQATLQMDSELLPGATAERVAKLEKDVSSLLLKTVTLEQELAAIKNRSWNPALLAEMNNKIAALQKQIKNLDNNARASAPPPANQEPSGRNSNQSPSYQTGNAPIATSQVQDRAGNKPDPLVARTGDAAPLAPGSQPRHTYKVQAGDTLFSVAQRYQVTTKDLLQWNNMKPDDVLKVGRTLLIY